MTITDSALFEILILVAIFGPLPVSFMTRGEEERAENFGFIIVVCIAWAALGLIGVAWPMAILIPAAWIFALKPIIKPSEQ